MNLIRFNHCVICELSGSLIPTFADSLIILANVALNQVNYYITNAGSIIMKRFIIRQIHQEETMTVIWDCNHVKLS